MQIIEDIMHACVILHNMVIEDEQGQGLPISVHEVPLPTLEPDITFQQFARGVAAIENEELHYSLRGDLIEHLWRLKGDNRE
jgi:hypothetical protein